MRASQHSAGGSHGQPDHTQPGRLDASVAVKWFVAEDRRKEARSLLGPRIERYAPDLLPVECATAICKKAHGGEIRSAAPFLDEITKLSRVIRIQPGETLLKEATETALRIGHPVYDCLYIACARRTGSVLVTADRKLSRVVSEQVLDVEAIALHDDQAMARVEAAGIRLVIDRETVEELSELWERVEAAEGPRACGDGPHGTGRLRPTRSCSRSGQSRCDGRPQNEPNAVQR